MSSIEFLIGYCAAVPDVDEGEPSLEEISMKALDEFTELNKKSKQFAQFIESVNWELLRAQKLNIIEVIQLLPEGKDKESFNGILHLLDSLQDKTVEWEYKTEFEVFGRWRQNDSQIFLKNLC